MKFNYRVFLLVFFMVMGFTAVSLRLIHIQLIHQEKYKQYAQRKQVGRLVLPARRGNIVDVHGHSLAQTVTVYDVRMDCELIAGVPAMIPRIAKEIGVPLFRLQRLIDPKNRYLLIKRNASQEVVERLRALRVQGLIFEERAIRNYPNQELLANLLGFLNQNQRGAAGIERALDRYLAGIPGERLIDKDGKQRPIAAFTRDEKLPVDGYDVTLTIDLTIQNIVEESLDGIMAEHRPAAAHIIVMRPKTGEILALGNRPTFNPNFRPANFSLVRNRCLTDMLEPGSTFKIVTLAAAINEGLISLKDVIDCERGRFFYANEWLRDTQAHDRLTVEEVIMKSSNIGFAKIALMLGADRLYDYAWRFGFGQRTQILHNQGEAQGILRPVEQWTKLSITRIPIGQEVAATPLQMANAMCAIANGGRLMMPRIIKKITDARGQVQKEFKPQVVRQVITPNTARLVSQALRRVVSHDGTAVAAKIRGFEGRVAGKTGTAQKFVDGTYLGNKYLASFIGYFPEEDPEVLILITVDEPGNKEFYGGRVAAPWFSRIGDQVAEYLGIPRTEDAQSGLAPIHQAKPVSRSWNTEVTSYYNAEEYP